MNTIEKEFGLRANELISTLLNNNLGRIRELKDILNEAVDLPLTFRTHGLRMGYFKLLNKKKYFNALFTDEHNFGIPPRNSNEWSSLEAVLCGFSLFQDHLYLGRCILMAEEIKRAAQIRIKPEIDRLQDQDQEGGIDE